MKSYGKQILLDIYGVVCDPYQTFQLITSQSHWREGIAVWILAMLFMIPQGILADHGDSYFYGITIGKAFWLLYLTAITHGVSRLFTKNGTFTGIFAGCCFSFIPQYIRGVVYALPLIGNSWGGTFISVIMGIWSFILWIIAIQCNYQLNWRKGLVVAIIPTIIPILCIIGLFVGGLVFGIWVLSLF